LMGVVLAGSFVSSPRVALKWFSMCIPFLPAPSRVRWLAEVLLLGRHSTPALRRLLDMAISGVTPDGARARLREIARVDVSRELKAIRVPVLYLRAREDRLVPSSCGEDVARLSARVTLATVVAPHILLRC
jgi:pimeloyl-ACP methyl ester carboxylesterase